MDPVFQSFLSGFPILLIHLLVTLAMLAAGAALYHLITPYHELNLIRNGNVAAAISFSAALLGLAIPLSVCMARSVNVWDIVIWGCVTLVIQLLAYRISDTLLRDLPSRIKSGEISAASLVAGIKLAISMINAAAVG